jgi:phage-related minor tail protein
MPIGTKVAELLVGIGVDLKDFLKGMKRLENRIQTVGKQMQKVGGTLTKGLTLPLLAAGAAAVKVASDAAEMRSKFDVVFPASGEGIVKQMSAFAAVTNQSKHEMIGLTATVGDILKPLGFTEQGAADLSVKMVQLAVDLSSFNNVPMDEALQRLQGALVGSH